MSIIEKALEKRASGRSLDHSAASKEAIEPAETRELTDATIKRPVFDIATAQDHVDLEIDFEMLESKGMLIPDVVNQISEEYRIIKRPLLMNAFGNLISDIKNSNLILVTSSLPGEGKTFTAVNLALSIATERDKTVLLVDADVAKPTISKMFGAESKAGLLDLLATPSTKFSDALLRTSIPNLSLLPAGKRHRHSTELLASESMIKLSVEMSERYSDRLIILDSPPLMVATQGGVLANHVGQVVMVIESEVTPHGIVKEAVEKLESCDIVGCVLNKTKKGFGLNYYAYYGYYGR